MLSLEFIVYTKPLLYNPLFMQAGQSIDLTDYLIQDTIEADFTFEYTKIFDFITSSVKFELLPSANINNILDLTSYQGSGQILTCKVRNDDNPDFWGVLDTLNSEFSREKQVYILRFNDIFKYSYDLLSKSLLGFKGSVDLSGFLKNYFLFSAYNVFVNVGDLPQTFQQNHANTLRNSDGGRGTAPTANSLYIEEYINQITNNDFLFELQKYYNAYIYTDGSGNIFFVGKNQSISDLIQPPNFNPNIDDGAFEEADTSNFSAPPQYNSILINYPAGQGWNFYNESFPTNLWTPKDYLRSTETSRIDQQDLSTYALIFLAPNVVRDPTSHIPFTAAQLVTMKIMNDLSNIPPMMNYYDLRFNLSGYSSTYRVFAAKTLDQVLTEYYNILIPEGTMRCKINRTDLLPMQKVTRFGRNFNIVSLKKYYDQNYSELELLPLVN